MGRRVLVSGASGPVGRELLPRLREKGFRVTRLVRSAPKTSDEIRWDPLQQVDPQAVSGFDAVVHLAGESIVGRWNLRKKKTIRDSRVLGTQHLAQALAQTPQPPRVLVSASAVGYYGDRGEEILKEDSIYGQGFLPNVCKEWEAATQAASQAGIRVVHIRIGMVLSPSGGALEAMLLPFRLGLGGKIGGGQQWWSWIDVRDLASAFIFAIENENLHGPLNAVAPNAVRNLEFTKTLGRVLSRPTIFPLPTFVARIVLGEMADELLLASQHIQPARLMAAGFTFRYADLADSLRANLRG